MHRPPFVRCDEPLPLMPGIMLSTGMLSRGIPSPGLARLRVATGQTAAAMDAMLESFFGNHSRAFRSARLRGLRLVPGLILFVLACAFGALINVVFAYSPQPKAPLLLAGLGGLILGSVWNLSVSSAVTWKPRTDDETILAADRVLLIDPENNVQI